MLSIYMNYLFIIAKRDQDIHAKKISGSKNAVAPKFKLIDDAESSSIENSH